MENNQKVQNDDLTVKELFGYISVFFRKWIAAPLVFLLRFIAKKWLPLLAFALAGFVCMFVWCHCFPVYKGVIMFQNNVWRSSDFILKLRQLNLEDKNVIARKLNMDPQTVKCKQGILPHFVYFSDSLNTACFVDDWDRYYQPHEDKMYILTSRFSVDIRTNSLESLDGWADGLLYYFKNDPYIRVLGIQREQSIRHRSGMVAEEIEKLDSLQQLQYFDRNRRNVNVGSTALLNQNPELYHYQVLDLSERLDDYESVLQYDAEPVVVVTDMQKEAAPLNYWGNFVVQSVLVGFGVGLLLLLIVSYRSDIVRFLKEEDSGAIECSGK